MGWTNDFQYETYSKSFDVPDGDHRVAILSAREVVSKNGKNMIEIHYKVEDSNGVDFVDRVIEGEYFNRNVSRIFDVFGIPVGNFNYNLWRNHVALAHFEHKAETFTDSNGIEKTVNKSNLIYFHNSKHADASAPVSKPVEPVAAPQIDDNEIPF